MKKKHFPFYTIMTIILLAFTIVLSVTSDKIQFVKSNENQSDYQIVLDVGNSPGALNEDTVVALTEDTPSRYVIWEYKNAKKSSGAHVLLHGDETNFGQLSNLEPINGILGVSVRVTNAASVELLGAYSLDGYYKSIYKFDTDNYIYDEIVRHPYIKFKSVDPTEDAIISEVVVTYSCVEHEQVADIDFGADPFNGTAATGVAGVGVALYYDATEDDVAVAFDKVAFTVNKPSGVLFDPVIGLVEKLSVYYLRPMEPGTYTVTLTVEDSAGLKATATKEIVVSTGDLSGGVDAIKAAIAAIYPDNIYTNLDYRTSEGVFNEWVVVGKNFTVFDREDYTGNYATAFIPFARFEGGEALQDFTISFKYTTLNEVWKLLFSFWTGEVGADNFAGDYLRLLTNRNAIGIQGDAQQASEFQDEGEATGIPLKEGPVWIKFTRQVTKVGEGDYTVVFKLFTSTDGETFVNNTTATLVNQVNTAGGTAGLLTGFLPFSIDNDFIVEDLAVSGTVFTLE